MEETPEYVTVDQLYEINAALFGKVNALEMIVGMLIEKRSDLEAFARRIDQLLLDRENAVMQETQDAEFTIRVHEATRRNIEAALHNARTRFGRP